MISMNQKQEIILRYHRDGQSKKRIAREVGVDVKTVRQYLRSYSEGLSALEGAEASSIETIVSALTEPPKYDASNRGKIRLTQEVQEAINGYLRENALKRRSGRSKQVMKKIDIHEALKQGGYEIGYTTVCNYIREQEGSGQEVYIRQHYESGQVCEFDWGEVKLIIDGVPCTYQLAVFTPAYSNYRWAWLFDRQDTASFQEAHALFFAHVGGVHYELVYDNMRVVIRRFVGRQEKQPTEGLLRLSMYYQFHYRFCNVGRGNEKGHVERSVEYVRRKAFAGRECFESRAEANAYLQERCRALNERAPAGKEKSAATLLEEEREAMHPCPEVAFECAEWRSLRADNYSTVNVGRNNYSVPEELAGKMVDVKVYPSQLIMYYQKQEVCCHERRYTPYGYYIELSHYLITLRRKPGALAGSEALRQSDARLRRIHDVFFRARPRQFLELLHYQRQKDISLDKLEEVLQALERLTPRDISLDKIRVLCERREVEPRQLSEPDTITQHARAQLQALAELVPQVDSLNVQTQVL